MALNIKISKKMFFIDGHERLDIVKDCKKFLNTMKDLKLYLIKFEKDESMKTKKYLDDYIVGKEKYYPIIIITYNKCIFSVNNRI